MDVNVGVVEGVIVAVDVDDFTTVGVLSEGEIGTVFVLDGVAVKAGIVPGDNLASHAARNRMAPSAKHCLINLIPVFMSCSPGKDSSSGL